MRRFVLFALVVLAFGGLASPASRAAPRSVPFQRAVTLAEWGPTAYAPAAVERRLRELRGDGVDTVTLVVVWVQRNGSSTRIAPGAQTVPTRNLVAAIRAARSLGMKVVLRPYVDRKDHLWRGVIAPASVSAWFASYRRFILRFASLAQRERVTGFIVGSEMRSVSGYADRWVQLVQGVRGRFGGFVSYQANHDETISWWSSLDVISISAYFPLVQQGHYTVDDLVRAWAPYFAKLDALRQEVHLPVMFGEIGYRSVAGSAMRPWDLGLRGHRSAEAQRRAYEAAFRVWFRVPWFRGMHWWYVTAQDKLLDGQAGQDHRPLRPALETVRRWYLGRR